MPGISFTAGYRVIACRSVIPYNMVNTEKLLAVMFQAERHRNIDESLHKHGFIALHFFLEDMDVSFIRAVYHGISRTGFDYPEFKRGRSAV